MAGLGLKLYGWWIRQFFQGYLTKIRSKCILPCFLNVSQFMFFQLPLSLKRLSSERNCGKSSNSCGLKNTFWKEVHIFWIIHTEVKDMFFKYLGPRNVCTWQRKECETTDAMEILEFQNLQTINARSLQDHSRDRPQMPLMKKYKVLPGVFAFLQLQQPFLSYGEDSELQLLDLQGSMGMVVSVH